MDKAEAKKRAEIMLAWANGETVQFRYPKHIDKDWRILGKQAVFDFIYAEYRIKPTFQPYSFKLKDPTVEELIKALRSLEPDQLFGKVDCHAMGNSIEIRVYENRTRLVGSHTE